MKSKKNVFWGLVFVLVAIFILVSQMGLIPEITIGFWSIVWTVLSLSVLINGISKFQFSGIFFGLAFLGIIYAEPLGITAITPWPILGAALLLSIGCHMLFPNRKHKAVTMTYTDHDGDVHEFTRKEGVEQEEIYEREDGEYLEFTHVFKSGTKYVQSPNLKHLQVETVFSSLEIYMTNTNLAGGEATVEIDNVFGTTNIYVPTTWIVQDSSESVFGSVQCKSNSCADGRNRLILKGDCVFGNIKVHYI